MSVHESAWAYRRFRWLKIALGLVVASTVAYLVANPPGERGGDTVVGYTLGTIGAALIAWLTWFGVRKRSYRARSAPLRGWLSAHVYLGATLLLLVPLHCAFQFGINLHTLAFVLMSAVIVSGLMGAMYYATVPGQMTDNRPGDKLAGVLERIAQLDSECRGMAEALPDVYARAVVTSIEETRLGGSWLRQLSGVDPNCGTTRALDTIVDAMKRSKGSDPAAPGRLLETLNIKRALVGTVRREIRYKALLQLWLFLHVPLAVATVVAVAAHIVVVFLYR